MLQKNKSICVRVYIIYINIYIYTHTIYVFLLNVFLWDFNQNKDKQAFHSNAFDHLQILNTKISSYLQLNWEEIHVWVCVCVAHAWPGSTTPAAEQVFLDYILCHVGIRFQLLFRVHAACQEPRWQSVRVTNQLLGPFCFPSNNCLEQLLEYCP